MLTSFIPRPEGQLKVVCAGEAGPVVVLLSGGGLDNALLSWKRLIPALAPSFRVIAFDWPKQGGSVPWRGTADHRCLLNCLEAVLDHFQVEKASLVGLSQGGAIALAYAIEWPGRVERLVAIAPAGTLRFPPMLHQALWLAAKLPWLTAAVSRLMFRSRAGVERLVRTGLFAGPSPDFDDVVDDIIEEIRTNGVSASDWQNGSIGFWSMNVDLTGDLQRINCPTLFIQGDRDVAVPAKFTEAAARRVPGAKLVVLESHGHWPNRQSPERVNALVRGFLADSAATSK